MPGVRCSFVLCCCGILFVGCAKSEESTDRDASKALKRTEGVTFLDVHFVLGGTAEELIERFGEPSVYRPQEGDQPYGHIRWNDVKGVRVYGIIRDGRCAYVNYAFSRMDPFDEAAAFDLVGIKRPEGDPDVSVPGTGVAKWYPFEQYERLTVSPPAKRIGVLAYPFETHPGF